MIFAISRPTHRSALEKTPLPSDWKGSFTEKRVIPSVDYPKHTKGVTPWAIAQSLGNNLKTFCADGLQKVSFVIIKIGGLRDLICLCQEKYQFDGICDLMSVALDFLSHAHRTHNFLSAYHCREARAYGKPDSLALRVRDTARPSALTWRGIEASFSPRLAWITEKINTLRTTYL